MPIKEVVIKEKPSIKMHLMDAAKYTVVLYPYFIGHQVWIRSELFEFLAA